MPRRLIALVRPLRRNQMLRQSLLVFGSTTLANVLAYAFQFAASHRLGVAHYGSLIALLAVVNLSVVPAAILTTIVVKYAAEFRALDDLAHLKRLVSSIVRYAGLAGVVLFAVAWPLAVPVGGWLRIADHDAVVLSFLLIALNVLLPVLRGVLQGVEDFRGYVTAIGLEAVGKAVFGIGAAFAGLGTAGMIGGWCVGTLAALVFSTATLVGRYRHVPDAPFRVDARRLVTTTINVAASTLVVAILSNADLIVVKHFFDAKTAGLYGLVALAGKTLLFLVGFVPTIVLPRAAAAATAGRSPLGVLLQGGGLLAVLAGAGLIGYAIAPTYVIIALGGKAYLAGASLVLPYAFAMVELAALNAVISYKTGIHRFDFVVPLVVTGVGELTAMWVSHGTPLRIVTILIVGNLVGLVLCSFRLNAPVAIRASHREHSAAA